VPERRSLFEMIFGSREPKQYEGATTLRMMNGFAPVFTNFGGNAYDSDVVRAAVDAIARNAAKLKPRHVRRVDGQIESPGSMLERLLAVRPNPYMDSYSFIYKVVTQLYLQNNSFIMIDFDRASGQVRALYPLNASTVEFMQFQNQVFVKFQFMGGQQITLPYNEVIHLRRFFYRNDLAGEMGDHAIMPTLEMIHATNEGIVNAIKSSAFLRGLLKFTSMLKPEDMKKQRDAFISDYLNVTNNGGIAVTDAKAEYVPLSSDPKIVDPKTMELIEDKVYKYMGVSAAIVRSDYTEDQWNAFYESVLEPIAIQLSLEFTSKLFTAREQGFGNEVIFEANRLQYASNKTKIELIKTGAPIGLLTINEAREIFNMAPVEGGDVRQVSLNFVDASKQNEYQIGIDEGGAENGTSEDENRS
jgi:HK97 family phage portal protein